MLVVGPLKSQVFRRCLKAFVEQVAVLRSVGKLFQALATTTENAYVTEPTVGAGDDIVPVCCRYLSICCCIIVCFSLLQSRLKLEKVHTIYKRLVEIQDIDPTLVSSFVE